MDFWEYIFKLSGLTPIIIKKIVLLAKSSKPCVKSRIAFETQLVENVKMLLLCHLLFQLESPGDKFCPVEGKQKWTVLLLGWFLPLKFWLKFKPEVGETLRWKKHVTRGRNKLVLKPQRFWMLFVTILLSIVSWLLNPEIITMQRAVCPLEQQFLSIPTGLYIQRQ